MLRIIHTADWHLGQSFHGYDRDYEHAQFLEGLLKTVCEKSADVLLIAGDVFDSINPPATAQRQLYEFLAKLHACAPKLQVVMIAGNHDAAARLEAPARLLHFFNATVVGTVERAADGGISPAKFLVPLKDAAGKVGAIAVAVPFLRPSDLPALEEAADQHLDGVRELYRQAVEQAEMLRDSQYPEAALIALGHCHMQDCVESRDSERRLIIGGALALHPDTFSPALAYVALGHLHKPQELADGRIYYCGSPIPLSFSEKDYEHRVLEIILNGCERPVITSLPIARTCKLMRVPQQGLAPIDEILEILEGMEFDASVPFNAQPFLEVRVLADGPDTTWRQRIDAAVEGKAVRVIAKREAAARTIAYSADGQGQHLPGLDSLKPEDILVEAYRERYNQAPPEDVMAAFRQIMLQQLHAQTPAAAA